MSTTRVQKPLDMAAMMANRAAYPPEQLLPFRDKVIAWDGDGSEILAVADSFKELCAIMDAEGIDASQVSIEWIPNLG